MQIGNSMPNLISLLISSEISRHGDNLGMGNVKFMLLLYDCTVFADSTLHFARLCCVFGLIFYLLICWMRFVATGPMHAPRSKIARIELNSTTEKNFTSCPAELYALYLCECVYVCVFVCVPCMSVCVAVSVCLFFSVFLRISCDFCSAFFFFFLLCWSQKRAANGNLSQNSVKSAQHNGNWDFFVGPKRSSAIRELSIR